MSLIEIVEGAGQSSGAKRRRRNQGGRMYGSWPYKWQAGAASRARDALRSYAPQGSATSLGVWGPSYAEATSGQKDLRKALRYKGAGSYWSKARPYIPRVIGGAVGGTFGGAKGAGQGWAYGAGVSKALGWGDYSVNQIVSDSPSSVSTQQAVHHISSSASDLSGDVVYSNTEFVTNIYATIVEGTSEFEIRSYPINPALPETFPFLSQIAQNFELFEFQGLMFQYKPTSGEFGSNNSNALGKVVLATNYDPEAPVFANAIQMENYDYACSTKPSSGAIHGVECAPKQRATLQLYTRTGESTKNKLFTDLGVFQLATEGIPSSVAQNVLIGELWVTYTVKLSRAKLFTSVGENILWYAMRLGAETALDYGTRILADPLVAKGSMEFITPETTPVANRQFTFSQNSNTSFNINFGNGWQGLSVLVSVFIRPDLAAGALPQFVPSLNCSFPDGSNKYWSVENSTQRAVGIVVCKFDNQFTGDAVLQVYFSQLPTATEQVYVVLSQCDPDMTLITQS